MQIINYPIYTPDGVTQNPKYKAFTLQNFRSLPQIQRLPEEHKFFMEVVGHVFPFKTNSYVVEELIDWNNIPDDPFFILTFPQKNMLMPHHFEQMAAALKNGSDIDRIKETADKIRNELNPHPAGQVKGNVPVLDGELLIGMQHKYNETVLFFPVRGQTCHAYCSFCFRWAQFVGKSNHKFSMHETERLVHYLRNHPEVSDILITGGDPLVMKAKHLAAHIKLLLNADLPNLSTIRIGTKALGFWPYRFITDPDADDLLALFRDVVRSGKHLAIMAHFSHPRELETEAAKEAILRIHETGAQIRTQAPLLAHVNDRPELWADMWSEQVRQGCIPYYMFIVRDTGAKDFFAVPLVKAMEIFRSAYQRVSGISRTVRGPIMSTTPGKVQVLGVAEVAGEQVIALQFLQARNPDWVMRPFFAKYDEKAIWLDELRPAFGRDKFFFNEA